LATAEIEAAWQPGPLRVVATNQPSIEVFPEARCGLFRQSDQISIRVKGRVPIRITSWRGNIVYEGKPSKLRLPCGHYFVDGGSDRTQFAVLPDDYKGIEFLGTEGPPTHFDTVYLRLARINPGYFRTMGGGTYWSEVQPARNQWHWLDADTRVADIGNHKLIYQAFLRPAWVTDEEFIPRYAEYVQNVAKRYGKKLYAIEIWNEVANNGVPGNDLAGVIDNYAKLVRASYEAVRKVSPTVKLLGPAWYGPGFNDETRRLAELGTFRLLDGFSIHDYMGRVMAPDTDGNYWLDSQHLAVGIVKQLQIYHAAVGDKPIFVDEVGLYGQSALGLVDDPTTERSYRSDLTWQRGTYRAIKIAVLYRTFGAVLIPHVFALNGGSERPMIQLQGWELGDRGPHPKTSAFLMTCYWLNGAKYVNQRTLANHAELYAWQRADGSPLVFAWSAEDHEVPINPELKIAATDVFGQEIVPTALTEEPILFRAPRGVSAEVLLNTVAQALKS
jgi:hypothetical protein